MGHSVLPLKLQGLGYYRVKESWAVRKRGIPCITLCLFRNYRYRRMTASITWLFHGVKLSLTESAIQNCTSAKPKANEHVLTGQLKNIVLDHQVCLSRSDTYGKVLHRCILARSRRYSGELWAR